MITNYWVLLRCLPKTLVELPQKWHLTFSVCLSLLHYITGGDFEAMLSTKTGIKDYVLSYFGTFSALAQARKSSRTACQENLTRRLRGQEEAPTDQPSIQSVTWKMETMSWTHGCCITRIFTIRICGLREVKWRLVIHTNAFQRGKCILDVDK